MQTQQSILVTGGAGFIGSNCVDYFLSKDTQRYYVNLDAFTYAGSEQNIAFAKKNYRYTLVKGNILDRNLLDALFEKFRFQGVIHFAAETHVDNSINGPGEFARTNVLGTQTLLDAARNYWMTGPFQKKDEFSNARFLNVSTDEVYGSLAINVPSFTEKSPFAPNNPYSASKAGADLLVRSYNKTYGFNAVTVHCSNNFGARQHSEKFIPSIIHRALAGENILIYGNGQNIRDWIYVEDHCRAIDIAFRKGETGESYNIAGKNERTNLELAMAVLQILDKLKPRMDGKTYREQILFVADRPGHDFRYTMDIAKINSELGWQPQTDFHNALLATVTALLLGA